ncbi:gliding motility-associated C-terminal domain-containing protein, partial [Cyclobacteriaceae bacterium]|nr:gliding motility-associated C-terminal domain-containing protein [Cyclobacteriaceae bacterium]
VGSTSLVFTIDNTAPTLSPVTIASNNSTTTLAKETEVITITFTSSEAIATPTVTIAGALASSVNNISSATSWTATLTVAAGTTEGIAAIIIDFADLAGNNGTSVITTTDASSVRVDRTAPTITSVAPSASSFVNVADVGYTLSEAIASGKVTYTRTLGSADSGSPHRQNLSGAELNIGARSLAALASAPTLVDGAVYTIDFDATDAAGNAATQKSVAAVTFDTTLPTLSPVTIVSNNSTTSLARVGDVITLAITSSEDIIAPTVTIAGVTATVTGSNKIWSATYTVDASTTEGTAAISIAFADLAGNNGTTVIATTNGSSVRVDTSAPTLNPVTIASNNADNTEAKAGDVITITFTSSEAIATPTVKIAGTAATVTNVSAATSWTATLTVGAGTTEGTAAIDIAFADLAGTTGTTVTATTDGSNVNIDRTPPTITITATNGSTPVVDGATSSDVALTVTFTTSEPSLLFLLSDVTSANGTRRDFVAVSSTEYTALFTPTTVGATTLDIAIGAFTDLAGNANTAAAAQFNWTFALTTTPIHVTCKGSSDGQITLTPPTGQSGSYEYDIAASTGALFSSYTSNTNHVFSGQTAGTYYIGVRDFGATDHSYTPAVTLLEPSANFEITATGTDFLCFTDVNEGLIDVNITSGGTTGVITYDLNTASGALFGSGYTDNRNNGSINLDLGTYYVGARSEENGVYCVAKKSGTSVEEVEITIDKPTELTLTIDTDPLASFDPLCYGASNGQLTVFAAGGTPSYSYAASLITTNFNYTNTTGIFSGGAGGVWNLSVKDANGCVLATPETVTAIDPDPLTIGSVTETNIKCFDNDVSLALGYEAFGSLQINMTSTGSNGLTYAIKSSTTKPAFVSTDFDGTNVTGLFETLNEGTYYVAVKDAKDCITVYEEQLQITEPDDLVANFTTIFPSCTGKSDGAIYTSISGGTGDLTYAWDNGATTKDLSDLDAAGGKKDYSLVVTDDAGCFIGKTPLAPLTETLYEGFGMAAGGLTQLSTTCHNSNDGILDLVPVVDDSGESLSNPYVWNVIGWTNSAGVSIPATNGTVSNPTFNNNRIINLGDDTYTISVSNGVGCTRNFFGTITAPDEIVLSLSSTKDFSGEQYDLINKGDLGYIKHSVSGGVPNYSYTYDAFSGGKGTLTGYSGDLTLYDTWADTWTETVTDANGCSATEVIEITGPATAFDIDQILAENSACYGDMAGTAAIQYTSATDADHAIPKEQIRWYDQSGALTLDGTDDFLKLPDGFLQTLTDFTFEAWFKKDANNNWSRIMDFGSGTGINMFLAASIGTGGVPRFAIKQSGGGEERLTPIMPVATGEWVHYAVTIDAAATTGKLYINGILVAENTNMSNTPSDLGATNQNYIGQSQYTADGFLDGTLDDVRIWSTVRTRSEIKENMFSELSGGESGLHAYYSFNEADPPLDNSGISSITDHQSSNLYDGTMSGFTGDPFVGGVIGTYLSEYTGLESITGLDADRYCLTIQDSYGGFKTNEFEITEPSELSLSSVVSSVKCQEDEDFGNALNFNATDNNRIVVADNNALDMTNALTIEAWVYPTKNSGAQTIVSKLSSAQAYGYKLTSDNGWSNVFFHLYFNTGNLNITSEVALTPTMLNSWHHIAATYDGANMKIFIDGIEAKSASQTGNIKTNTNELVIGAQRSSSGNNDSDFTNYFEGSLDEVRIWNVARSAAQINYAKDILLDGEEDGLVAYYQFNQGTAGGNNSGLSSLTEGINSLKGAFPTSTAFALTGSTSNFVTSYDNTPDNDGLSGGVVLTVTGGSGSYYYTWYKGSSVISGQTENKLNSTGTVPYPITEMDDYRVVVTDQSTGCQIEGTFNVEVASELSITGIVTPPLCKGGTDGKLDITPAGGALYTYEWTKAINDEPVSGYLETDQNLEDLGDGTYDITITETTSGCKSSASFDVASPITAYTIGIDITDATCFDDNDGALMAITTADPGHPTAYDYAWYSGAVAAGTPLSTAQKRIYDLAPGPYTMEVTDDYGCVLTSTATVSEEAEITFSTAATTNVTCFEGADGAINIGLSGGNGPYTHVWYKDGDEIYPTGAFAASPPTSLTGLSTGVYKVIVQDTEVTASPKKASCSVEASFNITEPKDFTVTATLVDPICQNGSNGQISVVVSGATEGAGYSYQWIKNPAGAATAAGTTATISGLTGDNPTGDVYQLIATDGSACVSDAFDYTLTSPMTTYDINASTTISEAVTALPTETIQSNVSCNGAADGYIEVKMTVDSGHPTDFDYAWYAGTSTTDPPLLVGEKNIYDLAPGQYTFQIIDFYGCTKDQTYTILEYPTMDISTTASTQLDNSCSEANDAAIGISVSGGNTANYYYEWSKNDIIFDPIDSGWTDTALSTLASGLYKVRVTDEQGCTADKSFEITTPEPLSLSYTQEDNICLGGNIGAIEVEVFGGTAPYDYAWTLGINNIGDTDILSNLTSDDYVLTVTDFAGCAPLTQSITIGGPTTTFTIGFTKTDLTCYESGDGTLALDLTLTGAHPDDYAISWYKGGNKFNSVTKTLSDLEANNYKVIMTDTSGCTKADSITLVQPEDINLNPVIDPLLCYDASTASIALNPTGGSDSYPSVDWSLAGTTVATNVLFADALASGDYNVLLRDSRGCQKDSLFKIVNPENMAVDTVNTVVQSVLCKGFSTGSIDFTVENGQTPYDYAWFQASSAYSTSEDIEDLAIGTYDLTVTDFYGCISDVFSFEITEPDNLYNINGDVSEVSCLDSSDGKIFISLEVLGASTDFTYSWNRNGALLAEDIRDLANLSAASYVFAATDNFGCTKIDTFALENPPTITALFEPILPSCYGDSTGSITVSAAGGWGDYEYDWLNPLNEIGVNDSVISNILSGNYLVKITDGAGCTKHFPVVLEGPDSISISPIITNNSCNATMNAGIAISVTGGTPAYSYQWLENGVDYATTQNIDSLTADNYELIVTDSLSCVQSSGIMEVITPDPLSFTVLSSQDNLCTNSNTGALFLQGSGGTFPYQYSIDGGSFGNASFFDGLDEGEHTFTINDTNNCSTDSLITVLSEYELIADFELAYTNPYIDWPISFNDSSLATDITSWFWELGNGASIQGQNSEFTYRTPGLYPITLKITNEVGCEAIKIDTLIIEKGYKLTMPSAFTPNGDALNDVFKASHENIIQTTLQLYNKYGALVFESTDLNAEWNGDLKDTPLPQDSYLYVIEYVAESGVARTERGRFTLLR